MRCVKVLGNIRFDELFVFVVFYVHYDKGKFVCSRALNSKSNKAVSRSGGTIISIYYSSLARNVHYGVRSCTCDRNALACEFRWIGLGISRIRNDNVQGLDYFIGILSERKQIAKFYWYNDVKLLRCHEECGGKAISGELLHSNVINDT